MQYYTIPLFPEFLSLVARLCKGSVDSRIPTPTRHDRQCPYATEFLIQTTKMAKKKVPNIVHPQKA